MLALALAAAQPKRACQLHRSMMCRRGRQLFSASVHESKIHPRHGTTPAPADGLSARSMAPANHKHCIGTSTHLKVLLREADYEFIIREFRIVAEIGDVRRFENPRQLMAYLGLVPSESSTGEQVRRG